MKLTTRFFCIRTAFLIICFFSTIAIHGQNNDFQHKKDSLLKVIVSTKGEEKLKAHKALAGLRLPEEEIDLKLQYINDFIREARKQQNKEYESMAYQNELVCLWNNTRDDEFKQKANEYLPFFKKNGFHIAYYENYVSLLQLLGMNGNYKPVIEGAKQMYAEAKQENCLFGIVKATGLMAQIYLLEDRYEDAEKRYQEVIKNILKLIKEDPYQIANYEILSNAYIGLASALQNQNKIDELLPLMSVWKEFLIDFEKTFGYRDSKKGVYYGVFASIYIQKGKLNEAELYCDSMEQINLNTIHLIRLLELKSQICEMRNEYDSAIDWIDKNIELNSNLGELDYMIQSLKKKAYILRKMGRTEESYSFFERAVQLNDSIRLAENNAQLDKIRTEYEVDKHIAEKELQHTYFLAALVVCIVLAIALGIWIYLNRKITKKNRILSQQISDWAAQQEVQVNEMLTKISFVPNEEKLEAIDNDLCVESQMDKLCIAIRDLLLKDKIYQNPTITQEVMVRQLGTNKNRFSKAMEYCFNMPFKDYINYLRLKDAVQLLEQSDMPILEISDKVGFGSERSFFRIFSEKYGITPNNYRNSRKITA
ncbi:MAG: helix-turn-helix domain-containing protein [Dysgonamonadaceae bacterium]|jgi:AraC-like DNA-binding protein|nr:helix-turn-helix domain-containing protein [Dysgonamonadaceae bacterium]